MVEQASAATHSLNTEVGRLLSLVRGFKLPCRPQAASQASAPTQRRPAARTLVRGSNLAVAQQAEWQDF
jgi:hypothetical protein